mgnify:CR=1 FL=1
MEEWFHTLRLSHEIPEADFLASEPFNPPAPEASKFSIKGQERPCFEILLIELLASGDFKNDLFHDRNARGHSGKNFPKSGGCEVWRI